MACVSELFKSDILCLKKTDKYFDMEALYWKNNVKQEQMNINYSEIEKKTRQKIRKKNLHMNWICICISG